MARRRSRRAIVIVDAPHGAIAATSPGVRSDREPPPAPAGPVTAGERAQILDALRGFALFGVCLGNLLTPFALWGAAGAPDPASLWSAATDGAAEILIRVLVEGKFYSLFSLLFGIGFAIQLQRAEARGEGVGRYVRRIAVLFAFGIAHILLVWSGDILALYALMGVVLVLLRRLPSRWLLAVALVLLLLPVADYAAYWLTNGAWAPSAPLWDATQALAQRLLGHGPGRRYQVVMSEDWQVFFAANQVGLLRRTASLVEQVRPAKVLAMFLIGLWVGRRRIFQDLDVAAPLLKRIAMVGLALGLPANVLLTWLMEREVMYGPAPDFAGSALGVVATLAYAVGVAPLAMGYAAAFALAWRTTRGRRVLGVFAPAGRMALTNYIAQSLIAVTLFYGVGFGLAGRIGPTSLWLLAALILTVQSAYSSAWLRHFRFGPLEWLWRTLTYGRLQPMRVAATSPTPRPS